MGSVDQNAYGLDNRLTKATLEDGASRGLGLEVARQLATAGFHVWIAGRDTQATEAAAAPIDGVTALPLPLDVGDSTSVDALAASWSTDPGALDVLINNAAGYVDWSETASNADLTAADLVMQVNLYGSWRMIQAFLPLLRSSEQSSNRQRQQRRRLPCRPILRTVGPTGSGRHVRHQQGRPQRPHRQPGRRAR